MSSPVLILNLAAGGKVLSAASLLLLLLFTPSCTVFRSVNKLVSDSISLKHVESQSNIALSTEISKEVIFTHTDSDKISYRVEIVPEGEFSYSPGAAFNGRAKSLVISGKEAGWRAVNVQATEMQEFRFDSVGSNSARYQVQTKVEERGSQKESKRSWGMGIVICLVLGLLLMGIRKAA